MGRPVSKSTYFRSRCKVSRRSADGARRSRGQEKKLLAVKHKTAGNYRSWWLSNTHSSWLGRCHQHSSWLPHTLNVRWHIDRCHIGTDRLYSLSIHTHYTQPRVIKFTESSFRCKSTPWIKKTCHQTFAHICSVFIDFQNYFTGTFRENLK